MGFDRSRVVEGLKRTNNDIGKTIELLQNEFEFYTSEASSGHFSEESVVQV